MGIILKKLTSTGPGLPDAEIEFDAKRQVIVGPSDTGKSYVRGCLWYLLGGDKPPKPFPLARGYQELRLRFTSGEREFEVRRSLLGGDAAVWARPLDVEDDQVFDAVESDISELLVELSGAAGMQILRNQSERGPVTGDDVRHWALWSQTEIPAEHATSGQGFGITKRVSSFNLFLSGNDDASIQLTKTKSEVERIKGQLTSAEASLERVKAGLPADVTRDEVADGIEKVDTTLAAITNQYEARATKLKELRREIADASDELRTTTNQRNHAQSMVARFELLDLKYANDLSRLGATSEGAAFFEALTAVPCPLCGAPLQSAEPHVHGPTEPKDYRVAIAAETEKIRVLRVGLSAALEREKGRYTNLCAAAEELTGELNALQNREAIIVGGARIEFSADPKTLAVRRTELSAQLAIFDELERLAAEIARLKKLKVRKRVDVSRDGGTDGRAVADHVKELLVAWGFTDIKNISLDAEECDIVINDRPRLSYGAGLRSLYLSALVIALMEHAVGSGYPHLGVTVIDSPLKAYADPEQTALPDLALGTVRERFYGWLSTWVGNGQIVILENEAIPPPLLATLDPIVFSKVPGVGRHGFYPYRDVSAADVESADSSESAGDDEGPWIENDDGTSSRDEE
jgi:hypothetical protein